MNFETDNDKHLETHRSSNPWAAYVDAVVRSKEALDDYPEFFDSDHLNRVREVADICNRFFRVKKGVYINHRSNRGNPYSVVKVADPLFPAVSFARKAAEYRKPIEALGCKFHKSDQGVIIHVK